LHLFTCKSNKRKSEYRDILSIAECYSGTIQLILRFSSKIQQLHPSIVPRDMFWLRNVAVLSDVVNTFSELNRNTNYRWQFFICASIAVGGRYVDDKATDSCSSPLSGYMCMMHWRLA